MRRVEPAAAERPEPAEEADEAFTRVIYLFVTLASPAGPEGVFTNQPTNQRAFDITSL